MKRARTRTSLSIFEDEDQGPGFKHAKGEEVEEIESGHSCSLAPSDLEEKTGESTS